MCAQKRIASDRPQHWVSLAAVLVSLTLYACDAKDDSQKRANSDPGDPRFGPWLRTGSADPRPSAAARQSTPAPRPQDEVEASKVRQAWNAFHSEAEKACSVASSAPVPRQHLKKGALAPGSLWGRLETKEGTPPCNIPYADFPKAEEVYPGRLDKLSRLHPGAIAETSEDIRALVCVDETTVEVGVYVSRKERVFSGPPYYARQVIWDVRILAWPSRNLIAGRSFRGDKPPESIGELLGIGPVLCGQRPWEMLNEWLTEGAEGQQPVPCKGFAHKGDVVALAISPSGALLASGSFDGDIKLWALPTGRLLKTLAGDPIVVGASPDPRVALAISPDGKLLASATAERIIKLWALPEGEILESLSGHESVVRALAITTSPDGMLLASGGFDGSIRLWALPDGRFLKTLPRELPVVSALAFSPDSKLLASGGGSDQSIRLWELPRGFLKSVEGRSDWVQGLSISANGKLLVSGDRGPSIKLWALPDGKLLKSLSGYEAKALTISSDGSLLATGGDSVRLWALPDLALLKKLWGLWGHVGSIDALAISPDSMLLATGGGDKSIRLWSLPTGAPKACLIDPDAMPEQSTK